MQPRPTRNSVGQPFEPGCRPGRYHPRTAAASGEVTNVEYWFIVLGGALAGGLLVLHGFSKTKETNDCVLDAYDDLLRDRQPPHERPQDHRSESHQGDPPPGDTRPSTE